MNKENKNLSRNRKRRIQRRRKIDDNMKLILKRIKSEKRKRNKNLDTFKQLETL